MTGATGVVETIRRRLGTASTTVPCCDTEVRLSVSGPRAGAALRAGRQTAMALERQLDAFDGSSAVATLAETDRVENYHVARLVERGLSYRDRTAGGFAIHRGQLERRAKAYIAGDRPTPPGAPDGDGPRAQDVPAIHVDGDTVTTEARLDLNGLAKGYIVDRTWEAMSGMAREPFVSAGGDMTAPPGPVAIESPWESVTDGEGTPLAVMETDWNVATSSGSRRSRGDVDHLYDPRSGHVGSRHESVTVLSNRDCTEADALATALQALHVGPALELVEDWPDAEALVVHEGVFHRTAGFGAHER